MQKALLIIDWEQEWIDPSSEYYIGSNLKVETERINRLIAHCRNEGEEIIFIKHVEPGGEAFIANHTSTVFIDGLDVRSDDAIITKSRISAFYRTDLEKNLKGVTSVIIAGILTNLCVRSAVQDAYDRDFEITIVTDCCIAFDKETQDFTLQDLKVTRPEIHLVNLEEMINL